MQVHGFTESGFIDATIRGVRLFVPDDPSNRHRQEIALWEYNSEGEQVNIIPPYVPPPPGPYNLYRSTFVERLTPEEAVIMEEVLNAEEAKLRLMYQSVDYFISDDPLFAILHWAVAQALGTEGNPNMDRADELLAP